MRRSHRVALALGIAVILLGCWAALRGRLRSPLSPMEARLVGSWASGTGGPARVFLPDRSFRTTNGQFEGEWSIAEGKLSLQYWEPARPQDARSVNRFVGELRKGRQVETVEWEIEFRDDNQGHTLIYPENHAREPGGRWHWMRQPELPE